MSSTDNSGTLRKNVQFSPRPLIVDLVGIGETVFSHSPSRFEKTMCLYTFIKDPVSLLESFCAGISQKLFDAGLEIKDPLQNRREGCRFVQAKAISTKGLRSGVPNTKPTLRHIIRDSPKIDASKALFRFSASYPRHPSQITRRLAGAKCPSWPLATNSTPQMYLSISTLIYKWEC